MMKRMIRVRMVYTSTPHIRTLSALKTPILSSPKWCVCVCLKKNQNAPRPSERVFPSQLLWTSDMWTHQPGSRRRKATRNFTTFLPRCLPGFFSREEFSLCFPSSTVKSSFVYSRISPSPLVWHFYSILLDICGVLVCSGNLADNQCGVRELVILDKIITFILASVAESVETWLTKMQTFVDEV